MSGEFAMLKDTNFKYLNKLKDNEKLPNQKPEISPPKDVPDTEPNNDPTQQIPVELPPPTPPTYIPPIISFEKNL
jgi:hypothetical protein